MSHSALATAFLLILGGASVQAEVIVRARPGRVDVIARAAPLTAVLEAFAERTGTEVTYEGSPPERQVTVTLVDRTPARALEEILQGLGVSYALRTDTSGERVEALHIVGADAAGTAAGAAASRLEPEDDQQPAWDEGEDPRESAETDGWEEDEIPEPATAPGMLPAGMREGVVSGPGGPSPPGTPVEGGGLAPGVLPPGMTGSPPGEASSGPEAPIDERVLPPPPGASRPEVHSQTPPPGMRLPEKTSPPERPER
jgi:hypothetical protein